MALFGQGQDGWALTGNIRLEGFTSLDAVAADVTGAGKESVVLVGNAGVDGGTVEYFNWHNGPYHRSLSLGAYPKSVAVGHFLPGRGPVIAASVPGGQLWLFAVDNTGAIKQLGQIAGVPTGPLAPAQRRDGEGDALLIGNGTSGTRYELHATGDVHAPYAATAAGQTERPFGQAAGRIAQDTDAWGNRWYSTGDGHDVPSGLSWFKTSDLDLIGENGRFLDSPFTQGKPVALDLYGHGLRDTVVALDGFGLQAWDVPNGRGTGMASTSGTEAAAIDADRDGRDDLAVAEGRNVTLYRNITGIAAPADPTFYASPDAYTRYPYFAITPHDGVRFEYRVGTDGDWNRVDGQTFDLRDVQDGPYRVTVRAVDDATGLSSKGVDVDFVLDTKAPAAPVVLSGPAETTSQRSATFAFESPDPDATFECLVDVMEPKGGDLIPWQPCGTPFTVDDLALGEHTVTVRQVDKAGNHSRPVSRTWTVVPPTPDMVVVPGPTKETVTTPAVETPAAPAKRAEPTPEPAKPAEPVKAKPVAAELAVGASAGKGRTPVATATGRRVAVGCAAPGAEGYRCAVTVTRGGRTVGEGRRTGAGIVPVNLDKVTARKVQRLGGLKVRVSLTVKTAGGETSTTHKIVRILPKKVLVVPTDGLFAFDSAVPSKGADALAKQIAGQLNGARTITIVGHTDAKGAADVNRRLGQKRAEAFRRLLAKHGFRGDVAVESAGDTQPRASNATDGGRALNRRVEIDVRY